MRAPRSSGLILSLLGLAPLTAQVDGEDIGRRVEAFDAHFDAANRLSGVLLIARGDTIVLHRAYGFAHLGLGVRNGLDTRIGIASITKVMTSIVLAQLVAERKLDMDAPIARWLPDFPRAQDITIAHLARHRAGIRHRVITEAEEALPLTATDIVERARAHQLLFEPGSASSYSSAGYTVLARCLELATGETFGRLLEQRIFSPAGMADTSDPPPGRPVAKLAECYVPGRGELWPAPNKDLAFLAGAGSVVSTAEDLWRFVRALRADKLVVPFAGLAREGRVTWTGASNGCFASVDTHPADDLTCIWVGNSWGGCAGALRDVLPALCRGETPTPRVRPDLVAAPAPARLAEYAGEYESRPGATSTVRVLGDELWFADSMLLGIGPDRFWHQPWHCELAFVRDEAGRVIAAERRDGASATRWPRSQVTLAQELEARCQAMAKALLTDPATVGAFYADDGALVDRRGRTVRGRTAIDAYWQRMQGVVDWQLVTLSVEGRDDLAWQRGRSILTREVDGARQVSAVSFLLVWRRDPDGAWRILIDGYW